MRKVKNYLMQMQRTDTFPHFKLPVSLLLGGLLHFELLYARLLDLLSFRSALLQSLDVLVVATEALWMIKSLKIEDLFSYCQYSTT